MTKLIVPQIGDIVLGQVVTEAAHKLWVGFADRIDALEGGGSDDLTEELNLISDRLDALETKVDKLPVIETIESGEDLHINPENYTYFEVSCIFKVPIGANLSGYGISFVGAIASTTHASRTVYNESYEIIVSITESYRATDFENGNFLRPTSAHNVDPAQAPVAQRWIIRKYKEN